MIYSETAESIYQSQDRSNFAISRLISCSTIHIRLDVSLSLWLSGASRTWFRFVGTTRGWSGGQDEIDVVKGLKWGPTKHER